MAASMYIVVQGEDPGYDTFVNGRALARHDDAVEKLALRLGVRPLIEFISADENLMAVLVESGSREAARVKQLPPPQWFRGEEGLATVTALIEALQDEPQLLGSEGVLVLEELREYEVVLRKTAVRGTRWHMAVSFR
jgi:hypothetical protein